VSVGGRRRLAVEDDDIFSGVGQIAQCPPGGQRLADLFLNRRVLGRLEDQIGPPRDFRFSDGVMFEEGGEAETGAGRYIVITECALLRDDLGSRSSRHPNWAWLFSSISRVDAFRVSMKRNC